jgi:hypothetical protein
LVPWCAIPKTALSIVVLTPQVKINFKFVAWFNLRATWTSSVHKNDAFHHNLTSKTPHPTHVFSKTPSKNPAKSPSHLPDRTQEKKAPKTVA